MWRKGDRKSYYRMVDHVAVALQQAFLSTVRAKFRVLSNELGNADMMLQGDEIEQGLLDEFYLWFRTDSDLIKLERQIRHAAETARGRVPVIAELSAYHPGSFQDPELMLTAARVVMDNGADGVGIYRSHAVEQLDLWPVLEKMGKL